MVPRPKFTNDSCRLPSIYHVESIGIHASRKEAIATVLTATDKTDTRLAWMILFMDCYLPTLELDEAKVMMAIARHTIMLNCASYPLTLEYISDFTGLSFNELDKLLISLASKEGPLRIGKKTYTDGSRMVEIKLDALYKIAQQYKPAYVDAFKKDAELLMTLGQEDDDYYSDDPMYEPEHPEFCTKFTPPFFPYDECK